LEDGSVHPSTLQWLTIAICLTTAAAQAGLLVVLSKKGLRKSFPVFFAYTAISAVMPFAITPVFLSRGPSSVLYFYTVWGLNSIAMLLEFGIMHEVFVYVVKPYSGLIDLTRMLFRWAVVFLLMAAVLTAVATTGSGLARCIAAAMVYVERGLRLMQCGMLLLFFIFERRLGLSWRSHAVSAAMGLSISAAAGLTLTYFRVRYPAWGAGFDVVEDGVYFTVVIIWLICFYLPQPARKNVLDSPARLIFQRWNEALMATPLVSSSNLALASNSQESFIPSVEKAVERVMARKMTH
jgi:hypothetical protein